MNIGPPFINQVRPGNSKKLNKVKSFIQKYKRQAVLALKMARCAEQTEEMVREIVRTEQTRDNMAFAGKKDDYLIYQGRAEGIAWAMKFGKKWKEKLL